MMLHTAHPHTAIARRLLQSMVATAVLAAMPAAFAQQDPCNPETWPTRTIELVSHASAGGGTDTTMRMWMQKAQELVDEDVIINYKIGGGARAAHEYFANRGPDCHTIMAFTQTHLYTVARGNSPITMEDMQGVARAMDDPSVIVVAESSPYATYDELVQASQEQALTWGVTSIGSTAHIGIERWAEISGAKTRIVPFGGDGEAITALRSGAVDAMVANVSESLAQIQEGNLRPLAVMAEARVEDLPDVPTTAEKGHDISVSTTRGYYVHADTPPEMVKRIERWILTAMESERFQEYLRSTGLDPETSIAGSEAWDEQMKENYRTALEAMQKLGLADH